MNGFDVNNAISESLEIERNFIQKRMDKHGETREQAELAYRRILFTLLPKALKRASQIINGLAQS
jgi:hypothetical protein